MNGGLMKYEKISILLFVWLIAEKLQINRFIMSAVIVSVSVIYCLQRYPVRKVWQRISQQTREFIHKLRVNRVLLLTQEIIGSTDYLDRDDNDLVYRRVDMKQLKKFETFFPGYIGILIPIDAASLLECSEVKIQQFIQQLVIAISGLGRYSGIYLPISIVITNLQKLPGYPAYLNDEISVIPITEIMGKSQQPLSLWYWQLQLIVEKLPMHEANTTLASLAAARHVKICIEKLEFILLGLSQQLKFNTLASLVFVVDSQPPSPQHLLTAMSWGNPYLIIWRYVLQLVISSLWFICSLVLCLLISLQFLNSYRESVGILQQISHAPARIGPENALANSKYGQWFPKDNYKRIIHLHEDLQNKLTYHTVARPFAKALLKRLQTLKNNPNQQAEFYYLWKLATLINHHPASPHLINEVKRVMKHMELALNPKAQKRYLNHMSLINRYSPEKRLFPESVLKQYAKQFNHENIMVNTYYEFCHRYHLKEFNLTEWRRDVQPVLCQSADAYLFSNPVQGQQPLDTELLNFHIKQYYLSACLDSITLSLQHLTFKPAKNLRQFQEKLTNLLNQRWPIIVTQFQSIRRLKQLKQTRLKMICHQHLPVNTSGNTSPEKSLYEVLRQLQNDDELATPHEKSVVKLIRFDKLMLQFQQIQKKSHHHHLLYKFVQQVLKNYWELLITETQTQLNYIWEHDVYQFYHTYLKTKFPFQWRSENDASLSAVYEFLGKPDNIFSSYLTHYASQAFSQPELSQLKLALNLQAQQQVNCFRTIQRLLYPQHQATIKVGFAIYPYPHPDIKETILYSHKLTFRYCNEPQTWQQQNWVAKADMSFIKASSLSGRQDYYLEASGIWAFWRLLQSASIQQQQRHQYKIQWKPLQIDIKFNAESDFVNLFFQRQCQLPKKLF